MSFQTWSSSDRQVSLLGGQRGLVELLAELVGPDEVRAEVVADAMAACHRSNVGTDSECLLAAGLIRSDRRRRRSDVAGHEARRRRRT